MGWVFDVFQPAKGGCDDFCHTNGEVHDGTRFSDWGIVWIGVRLVTWFGLLMLVNLQLYDDKWSMIYVCGEWYVVGVDDSHELEHVYEP